VKYAKPVIVDHGPASSTIRGAKGIPFSGDLVDPTKPPYMHTQNAYEADE
jgi:hypothetical protein